MPSYNTSRNYHNPQFETNYPISHRTEWVRETQFKMVTVEHMKYYTSDSVDFTSLFRVPADARNLEIVQRYQGEDDVTPMAHYMVGIRYEVPVKTNHEGITYYPRSRAVETFPRNQHMTNQQHKAMVDKVVHDWENSIPAELQNVWASNSNQEVTSVLDSAMLIDCHRTLSYVKSMDAAQTEIFLALLLEWKGSVVEAVVAAKTV